MKYALIKNGELDHIKEWEDETPPDLSHKIGVTLEWLPYVVEDIPAYDSNIQNVEKTTTISATEVSIGWTIVERSKEEIKSVIEDISAEKIQNQLGDITDRLSLMTQATMLLDAVNQGLIQNDDSNLTSLRSLGDWWKATRDHADSLKADVDADLNPDITAGWPVI